MISHLKAGLGKWEALAYNGVAASATVKTTPSKAEGYRRKRMDKLAELPTVFTVQTVVNKFDICRTRAESLVRYLQEDKAIEKAGKIGGKVMQYKKVQV